MRHIEFDPETLPEPAKTEWEAWLKRSKDATDTLIQNFTPDSPPAPGDFDDKIWGDLKVFLLEHVFHHLCAYCEARVDVTGFGDAEHWRPKGKVTVKKNGKAVKVKCGAKAHSGYYWLAYDWRNLLPACSQCNTIGKANHFPVAQSHACIAGSLPDADGLDLAEQPLLLHPYRDMDPSQHLTFNQFGHAVAQDDKGAASLEIYNLNRESLISARQSAQQLHWLKFLAVVSSGTGDPKTVIEQLESGVEPHSTAAMEHIRATWAALQAILQP